MDLFFTDPSEVPLPPHEVRLRDLRAQPDQDGRRVRVYVEVDPFQKRPSLELAIVDRWGNELSTVSVIETMTRKMSLTMHLRQAQEGSYTLKAVLFYRALQTQEAPLDEVPSLEQNVVDRRETVFSIPAPNQAGQGLGDETS